MAFNPATYLQQTLAKGKKFVQRVEGKTLLMSREVFGRDRWNRARTVKRVDVDVMVPAAYNPTTGVTHKVTLHITGSFPQQVTAEELAAATSDALDVLQSKWLEEVLRTASVVDLTVANGKKA